MGRKAKRKIARLSLELDNAQHSIAVHRDWLKDLRDDVQRKRWKNEELNRQLSHIADVYHRELARYKFIDDILTRMSNDPEYRRMPLFRYMQGERQRLAPDSWRGQFPPYMRQAIIPQLSWNRVDVDPEVQALTIEALEYYLFRYYHGHQEDRLSGPAPVIEYELNGARRAYMLPKEIARMPEAEALQIVMREIAPAVLAMFKEVANRG